MLVFCYAVELDAADAEADGHNDLLLQAARAYRTRAACLQAKGDPEAARRDVKRAERLEAKVKKADGEGKAEGAPARPPGRVTVRNNWDGPVTLVIADVSYPLQVGETKELAAPEASFPYQLQAGPHRIKGTMSAGRAYTIGPRRAPAP